jgi:pimeloyl-ACP methyl ester carboxylesterase
VRNRGRPDRAHCGTLTVPENRATGQGRTIALKIVVAPALRRDAAPDPLFILEGGPGAGAATLAGSRLGMFRRFRTDRDLVFVDQRGTGESNRLGCDPSLEELDEVTTDDDRALTRARLSRRTRRRSAPLHDVDCDGRPRRRPPLPRLRPDQPVGGSYGTRAALVYLRQHEAHVRSRARRRGAAGHAPAAHDRA